MGLIKEGKNSTILLDVCICMKSNLLGEKLSKEPPFLLTNETLFDWRLMCYKQSPSPSFLQNRIWLRCHWVDHLWQDCYLQPQIPVSLANLKFLSLYPSFSSIIGWEGSPRKNVVLPLFFNKYTMKRCLYRHYCFVYPEITAVVDCSVSLIFKSAAFAAFKPYKYSTWLWPCLIDTKIIPGWSTSKSHSFASVAFLPQVEAQAMG